MTFELQQLTNSNLITRPECQKLIDQTQFNLSSNFVLILLIGVGLTVASLIYGIKEKNRDLIMFSLMYMACFIGAIAFKFVG